MNKAELYKEIDSVEQQISKIYFEIMDKSEISPYKRSLLEEKLNLLAIKLQGVVDAILILKNMEKSNIKKKIKRTFIMQFLVLVLIFINPLLAFALNIYIMVRINQLKK